MSGSGRDGLEPELARRLWREANAEDYGFTTDEFADLLYSAGDAKNFGLPSGHFSSAKQQATFISSLHLANFALARACAKGIPVAWDRFHAGFNEPIKRAAWCIAKNDAIASDLATALPAELYGIKEHEGRRICPLDKYMGTKPLFKWMYVRLVRRYIDTYRRVRRETLIDGYDPTGEFLDIEIAPAATSVLDKAVEDALRERNPTDRFILVAYFLDDQPLRHIGQILNVHEATASRKLKRLLENLRKHVLRNLQDVGLSKRAAQEMLGTNPGELGLGLRKILQDQNSRAFITKA